MTEPFDLMPFCDSESGRYALETPWVHDGWCIATDGRICVRYPTTLLPTGDDGRRRPKANSLFVKFPRCVNEWPHHDGKTEQYECRKCKGTTKMDCVCEECGDRHFRRCTQCLYGVEIRPQRLTIAGRLIAGELCLKIEALGDVKYAKKGNADEALAFVCGELQGLVMPIRKE